MKIPPNIKTHMANSDCDHNYRKFSG